MVLWSSMMDWAGQGDLHAYPETHTSPASVVGRTDPAPCLDSLVDLTL